MSSPASLMNCVGVPAATSEWSGAIASDAANRPAAFFRFTFNILISGLPVMGDPGAFPMPTLSFSAATCVGSVIAQQAAYQTVAREFWHNGRTKSCLRRAGCPADRRPACIVRAGRPVPSPAHYSGPLAFDRASGAAYLQHSALRPR